MAADKRVFLGTPAISAIPLVTPPANSHLAAKPSQSSPGPSLSNNYFCCDRLRHVHIYNYTITVVRLWAPRTCTLWGDLTSWNTFALYFELVPKLYAQSHFHESTNVPNEFCLEIHNNSCIYKCDIHFQSITKKHTGNWNTSGLLLKCLHNYTFYPSWNLPKWWAGGPLDKAMHPPCVTFLVIQNNFSEYPISSWWPNIVIRPTKYYDVTLHILGASWTFVTTPYGTNSNRRRTGIHCPVQSMSWSVV